MSQIYNDPDKLRAFAFQLERFSSALDEHLTRLGAAMSRLGNTWEDEGFAEFVSAFSNTRGRVSKFVQEANNVLPKLKEDAENLDQMLSVHTPR
jgi:uncharacterized protein YukE